MNRLEQWSWLALQNKAFDSKKKPLSPNLLNFASLACPQQKFAPDVREDAIAQVDDVAGLEGVALIPPQLEVNHRRLIHRKRQARLVFSL